MIKDSRLKKPLSALIVCFLFFVIFFGSSYKIAFSQTGGRLRVSSNGRWLERSDTGEPVFLMAESAWRLHALLSGEQDTYFQNRQGKKFNAAYVGLTTYWEPSDAVPNPPQNANGDEPFNDSSDPFDWNSDYFEHMSGIIERAASYGFYIILEMGDPIKDSCNCYVGDGNTSDARRWGEVVGDFFGSYSNVIFALGQDGDVGDNYEGDEELHRAVADGLEGSVGSVALITYHPKGGSLNSSDWFHNDSWLDFNTIELYSESKQDDIYPEVQNDYNKSPTKPTWVIEAAYEDRESSVPEDDPKVDEYWIRYSAYQGVFAGAFGTSYGHHYNYYFPDDWRDKLDTPGVSDMLHLFNLIDDGNRNFTLLGPDQDVITSSIGSGFERRVAVRASNGAFVYVYLPRGGSVTVDMAKISSGDVVVQWYNPRNGAYSDVGTYANSGTQSFSAPGSGKGDDYVLVLTIAGTPPPSPTPTPDYPTDLLPVIVPVPELGDRRGPAPCATSLRAH